jgi:hypothetical protein
MLSGEMTCLFCIIHKFITDRKRLILTQENADILFNGSIINNRPVGKRALAVGNSGEKYGIKMNSILLKVPCIIKSENQFLKNNYFSKWKKKTYHTALHIKMYTVEHVSGMSWALTQCLVQSGLGLP